MKNYKFTICLIISNIIQKSIKNPKNSGTKLQDENFVWYQRWNKVVKFDMEKATKSNGLKVQNSILLKTEDRHLAEKRR